MIRLHHVNIVVPPGRTDDVTDFYTEALGLTRVPKPPEAESAGAWFDIPGGTQLHISERAEPGGPTDRHFALVVDDFDATVSRLPQWEPVTAMDGARRAKAMDPLGNQVELIEAVGSFAGSFA